MISGVLGIDPALVFFMLLTTISASLWFFVWCVENSRGEFWQKSVEFICAFICSFFLTNFIMISFVKSFYLCLVIL